VNRKRKNPEVATPGEIWEGLKGLPRETWDLALMPSTWLCFLLMTVFLSLYVLVPALLLSYVPARLFGATEGTPGLDITLGILLFIFGSLIVWRKVNRVFNKKYSGQKDVPLLLKNTPAICFKQIKEVSHGE
jgi:membrane protein implicated in regulation of membrane protease activity